MSPKFSSFTFHVHLGGLHDLLVDDKLWQRFEQRRGGMNEHRLVHKRRLWAKTDEGEEVKDSNTKLSWITVTVLRATCLVAVLPFWVQNIFCLDTPGKMVSQSGQNNLPQAAHLVLRWWSHLGIHKYSYLWTHCVHWHERTQTIFCFVFAAH